jgi:hypothetical protein
MPLLLCYFDGTVFGQPKKKKWKKKKEKKKKKKRRGFI